jgi:hypothetical protein
MNMLRNLFNGHSLCVVGGAVGAMNGLTTGKGALFILTTLGFSMPVAVPLSIVLGAVAGIGATLPALMLARKLAKERDKLGGGSGNAQEHHATPRPAWAP